MSPLAHLLRRTILREISDLRKLSDETAALKPKGPESWSPKEELGHLIDSAANNHQRFARAALDGVYRGPGYAQNDWVRIHGYRDTPWNTLVSLWEHYNYLLVRLIENIPENNLDADCFIGSADTPATLAFVIDDYVLHMRHHIDHLLRRQLVTEYPRTGGTAASATRA